MFSDESHFRLRFGSWFWPCRRLMGSNQDKEWVTMKSTKNSPKVMPLGCFSWKEHGRLEFLIHGEMMNGVRQQ